MNDVTPRSKLWIDPVKEAKAVAALLEGLRSVGAADDDALVQDSIEGQTQFLEVVDLVLDRMTDAEVMIEGIQAIEKKLAARRVRYEQRNKADRALLEQALTIAEQSILQRPAGTLSLSARAPSLSVTEESAIPAAYWKTGDPTLDKKTLTADLKAREKAIAALPTDPEARAAALASLPPDIPGACLNNGAPSLTIRRA